MICGLLFGLGTAAAGTGGARPITARVAADGTVTSELDVPAPLATVRAALLDPIAAARFSPDTVSIAYVARGGCDVLHVETGVTFAPVAYDYRRCATADGWHETLVSSKSLSDFDVRWGLTPVDIGTHITYQIRIGTAFPAPTFLVTSQLKSSMATELTRLYHAAVGA
jgi:hypothetical protein